VEWMTGSIGTLALPTIAILSFKADAFDMGLLTALNYAAYPLLGLFAGVMVDRWRRKPVLVWTNVVQFVAFGSIPLAFFLGVLSLIQLFMVALVLSVTVVFFNIAYTSYLPTLISREDVVEGNSKLETSSSVATVVGPGIAGCLIQVFGAAPSITADAFGTLFAAFAIFSIRKHEPHPSPDSERNFWREMKEGFQVVREIPSLQNLVVATSILNVGNTMFLAVFFLFVYDELRMSPLIAGIALAMGGVGVVIGAVVAPRLLRKMGLGPVLTTALLINGLGYLAVRASTYGPSAILLALLWLIANMGIPIYNINQVSFRQTIVPDRLQGRMNATMRAFSYGAATLGALIGGVVGAGYGIQSSMIIGAIVALSAAFLIRFGPIGAVREIPKTTQ